YILFALRAHRQARLPFSPEGVQIKPRPDGRAGGARDSSASLPPSLVLLSKPLNIAATTPPSFVLVSHVSQVPVRVGGEPGPSGPVRGVAGRGEPLRQRHGLRE